jgi:hypothetical protein
LSRPRTVLISQNKAPTLGDCIAVKEGVILGKVVISVLGIEGFAANCHYGSLKADTIGTPYRVGYVTMRAYDTIVYGAEHSRFCRREESKMARAGVLFENFPGTSTYGRSFDFRDDSRSIFKLIRPSSRSH